jgi:hypothetical protein
MIFVTPQNIGVPYPARGLHVYSSPQSTPTTPFGGVGVGVCVKASSFPLLRTASECRLSLYKHATPNGVKKPSYLAVITNIIPLITENRTLSVCYTRTHKTGTNVIFESFNAAFANSTAPIRTQSQKQSF